MKLNNKGFAVSIILYSIIAVIILILLMILAVYATNIHNKMSQADRIKEKIGNLENLNNKILGNNNIITSIPTLISASSASNDTPGLYKSISTTNNNPTYYFRGNVNNNYVSFAGFTWRIVRINEDSTIKIIMQDGINNNSNYSFSTTANSVNSMYYSNSSVKTTLDAWYTTNITNKSLTKYVETGKYFCEQAKVSLTEAYGTGSGTTMVVYTGYTPDFKCIKDTNGKGLINASVGLISYDEVIYAGGKYNTANTTYYLRNGSIFYTGSPAGFSTNAYEWIVSNNGSVLTNTVNTGYTIRPVINLKAYLPAKGKGTSAEPYTLY